MNVVDPKLIKTAGILSQRERSSRKKNASADKNSNITCRTASRQIRGKMFETISDPSENLFDPILISLIGLCESTLISINGRCRVYVT